MKWIAGFLSVGLTTFVLFGCVAGRSFEAEHAAQPAVMRMEAPPPEEAVMVPEALVEVVGEGPLTRTEMIRQLEALRNPQVAGPQQLIQLDQVEEYSRFSRSGPIRHKKKQVLATKNID